MATKEGIIMLKVNDLVTVKATSPKYKWYKDKVGIVHQVPAEPIEISDADTDNIRIEGNAFAPIPGVMVVFNGVERCFNKDELKKV